MKPEIKKLLILNLPYLLFVWLFDKVGAAVRLIVYSKGKNAKKYRKGEEYGSARCGA